MPKLLLCNWFTWASCAAACIWFPHKEMVNQVQYPVWCAARINIRIEKMPRPFQYLSIWHSADSKSLAQPQLPANMSFQWLYGQWLDAPLENFGPTSGVLCWSWNVNGKKWYATAVLIYLFKWLMKLKITQSYTEQHSSTYHKCIYLFWMVTTR